MDKGLCIFFIYILIIIIDQYYILFWALFKIKIQIFKHKIIMKTVQPQTFANTQSSATIKKINLQQYQKPKTLIVVHYKGKRISVPLLGDCKNLTQMLYHHIDKFEQTVMKSQANWQKVSRQKIVCFCSLDSAQQSKNKSTGNNINSSNNQNQNEQLAKNSRTKNSISNKIQQYLKYSDGDLKIDILLSLIRIQNSQNQSKFSGGLDITKYYKYMEIQPFYVVQQHQKQGQLIQRFRDNRDNYSQKYPQVISMEDDRHQTNNFRQIKTRVQTKKNTSKGTHNVGKYYFYRLLQSNRVRNIYLARSVDDGYFYEIKIYRTQSQAAQRQANFLLYVIDRSNRAYKKFEAKQNSLDKKGKDNGINLFNNNIIMTNNNGGYKNNKDDEQQSNQQFFGERIRFNPYSHILNDPITSVLNKTKICIIPFEQQGVNSQSEQEEQDQSQEEEQSDQQQSQSDLKFGKNGIRQRKPNFKSNLQNQNNIVQQSSGGRYINQNSEDQDIKDDGRIFSMFLSNSEHGKKQKKSRNLQYKHLVTISKFNPKGKLSQKINKSNILPTSQKASMSMNQILKYLKQLVRIVHTLHEKYNIIHRSITPDNIQIDELGNLRLVNFTSWLKCYQFQFDKTRHNHKRHESIITYPKEKQKNSHNEYPDHEYSPSQQYQYSGKSRSYEDSVQQNSQLLEYFQGNRGEWYDIGIYTPIQVKNRSPNGYNKMVDYYSVGMITKQLYENNYTGFQNKQSRQQQKNLSQSKNKGSAVTSKLMQKIISGLISQDVYQRWQIVKELLQGIFMKSPQKIQDQFKINVKPPLKKQNQTHLQQFQNQMDIVSSDIQITSLNELCLGKFIPLASTKCVQNQLCDKQWNGISHQEVIQYFRPIQKEKKRKNQLLNKTKTKVKNKKKSVNRSRNKDNESKSNVSVTNSRQKSNKKIQKNSSSVTSHSQKTNNNNVYQISNNSKTRTKSKQVSKSKQKSKQKQLKVKKQPSKSIQKNSNTISRQKDRSQHSKKKKKIGYIKSQQSEFHKQQAERNSYNHQSSSKNYKFSEVKHQTTKLSNKAELHVSNNMGLNTGGKTKSKSKDKNQKLQYPHQKGATRNPMTNTAYSSIGSLNIPHPRK